jgi:hypothetical protein
MCVFVSSEKTSYTFDVNGWHRDGECKSVCKSMKLWQNCTLPWVFACGYMIWQWTNPKNSTYMQALTETNKQENKGKHKHTLSASLPLSLSHTLTHSLTHTHTPHTHIHNLRGEALKCLEARIFAWIIIVLQHFQNFLDYGFWFQVRRRW